ncbi:unnamed protein product [Nippostrongylus brasiliensis]|uniref:CPSF_A domain-containing protein n=1 Tax=Nippostrongylus brasiliensis TaxID=27835 RepID=A0A0N4YJM2_NIPBR|nr:unnamed protein product [Nippostrongylus brasiliensis]
MCSYAEQRVVCSELLRIDQHSEFRLCQRLYHTVRIDDMWGWAGRTLPPARATSAVVAAVPATILRYSPEKLYVLLAQVFRVRHFKDYKGYKVVAVELNEIIQPRACGLMDKASDFGSEDCRFESCQGRNILLLGSLLKSEVLTNRMEMALAGVGQ